jgi:hypothetical protein
MKKRGQQTNIYVYLSVTVTKTNMQQKILPRPEPPQPALPLGGIGAEGTIPRATPRGYGREYSIPIPRGYRHNNWTIIPEGNVTLIGQLVPSEYRHNNWTLILQGKDRDAKMKTPPNSHRSKRAR